MITPTCTRFDAGGEPVFEPFEFGDLMYAIGDDGRVLIWIAVEWWEVQPRGDRIQEAGV